MFEELFARHGITSDREGADMVTRFATDEGLDHTVDRTTFNRIRRGIAGSERTVRLVGRALGAELEVLEAWRAHPRSSALSSAPLVPRAYVRSVEPRVMSEHDRAIELSLAAPVVSNARATYIDGAAAPEALLRKLGRNPIDARPWTALGKSLGLGGVPFHPTRPDLAALRQWFDELHRTLVEQLDHLPEPVIEQFDAVGTALHGEAAEHDAGRRLQNVSLIVLLAGGGGHDARIERALNLCTTAKRPPHILIFGAPASPRHEGLLGEADRAWIMLGDLARGRLEIDDERVVVDQRPRSFADAAGLLVDHLLTARLAAGLPHVIALISGPMATLRPTLLFRQAVADRTHLVREIIPVAAHRVNSMLFAYPRFADEWWRRRWVDTMVSESEKLFLMRATGVA